MILKASAILTLLTGINAQQNNQQQQKLDTCTLNSDCVTQLSDGACCLYEETLNFFQCRSKTDVNYFLNPRTYNQISRTWTNPEDQSEKQKVYCKNDRPSLPFTYPYPQPFVNNQTTQVIAMDLINPGVRSDMFFKPYQVQSFNDQIMKWLQAGWFLTPLPSFIWWNNIFYYGIDTFTYMGDPSMQGIRPSMYTNWFTAIFMSSGTGIWGPFQYYDVFSLKGFDNWFWDAVCVYTILWWELIEAIIRNDSNDWQYSIVESTNFVDMNRLYSFDRQVDPFDYGYYSQRESGVDCNGNVGRGYYCLCADEGYICKCNQNFNYAAGENVNQCYDYYGYDCSGNIIDGLAKWCQEDGIFYYQNQKNKIRQ